MPRAPLSVQPPLLLNKFGKDPSLDELISRFLEGDILPPRKKHPRRFFAKDDELHLYITERETRDRHISPDVREGHESYLDSLFWNDNSDPFICIVGSIGCGKSTFVDYYIRHYCFDRGTHSAEFEKKFVVYFDARDLSHSTDAFTQFYQKLKDSIEGRCREFGIAIQTSTQDIRQWVCDTLAMLSKLSAADDGPFKYIVFVLDNLDNATPTVQRQVLQYARFISTLEGVNVYRIVVPLWPTTFSKLKNTFNPHLNRPQRLTLGPPEHGRLVKRRIDALREMIIDRKTMGNFTRLDEAERFVNFFFDRIDLSSLGKMIRDLTFGDLRRELSIWRSMLRSEAAGHIWISTDGGGIRKAAEHDWHEAIFAGGLRTEADDTGVIANLYNLAADARNARDFLIGYHGLHFLAECNDSRPAWVDCMVKLGYSIPSIEYIESQFVKYNIAHLEIDGTESHTLHVHDDTVAQYRSIVSHPVYVANYAMVTPVDEKTRVGMKITSGVVNEDFRARAESTSEFIEFIASQEIEFASLAKVMKRDDRIWVNSRRIPLLSRTAAARQIERLEHVRNDFRGLDNAWWEKAIRRLVELVQELPQYLQV